MMGINEFLKFEKKLTALIEECGIGKYLKMRDERLAYVICQHLQNLWDVVRDRDEWNMFLDRMEEPKPSEADAFTRRYTAKVARWNQDTDHYMDDAPKPPAESGLGSLEPLRASQDLKAGVIIENEPAVQNDSLVQVEGEIDNKFQELEKRYVSLLGVVESLLATKDAPEKYSPDVSFKEPAVPVIQFPDPETENDLVSAIQFPDPVTENDLVSAIQFPDSAPEGNFASAIQFPDLAPAEGNFASAIQFPDPVTAEGNFASAIQFPDPVPAEGNLAPAIQFPDPTPKEPPVSAIQFPDPMPGEISVSTMGFQELPFNLEQRSAPEAVPPPKPAPEAVLPPKPAPEAVLPPKPAPEAVPPPKPRPATGFALETNSYNTSSVSNVSDTPNLWENCQRIGHPEAGFHISCFKCEKQQECQNSHEKKKARR